MKYYAVIDTNVIVSAYLHWDSVPGNLMDSIELFGSLECVWKRFFGINNSEVCMLKASHSLSSVDNLG